MVHKLLPKVIFTLLAASWFTAWAFAQSSPLPLGTISDVRSAPSCPVGYATGASCFTAMVSCPNTLDLPFTFGYENPQQGGAMSGTIVFFNGADGTVPGGSEFATALLQAGYRLVQINWDTAWEDALSGVGTDIKTAACRPATFLNFVHQNLYTSGGMCGWGSSAGSGALAYSLAWYGAADYMDSVELLSGPVFSDIERGCAVPPAPPVFVCPNGQLGCNTGFEGGWLEDVQYVNYPALDQWTGINACDGGQTTSVRDDEDWKSMSIVDGTSGPTFVYPRTNMAGWLCATSIPSTCNPGECPNNSAAEGEIFYEQFTDGAQIANYSVTRIDQCNGPEGVNPGVTPQGVSGLTAITQDMIAKCRRQH